MAVGGPSTQRIAGAEPLRETSYVYAPPSHRLLFRGSLSIPGSTLLLEGLTFTVPLHSAEKTKAPVNLIENPLALALESMRGRTLALSGTVRLDSVYLDKSTEVSMDIHPAARLSRSYFENQLCATSVTSAEGTTDMGVRITLGDPGTDSASEILIYGKLPSPSSPTSASTSKSTPPASRPILRLLVARILPAPPTPSVRLPRPDDPSPRVPPLVSFGKKRALSAAEVDTPTSKRKKGEKNDGMMVKRARDVIQHGPSRAPSPPSLKRADSLRRSVSIVDEDVFKVPSLPHVQPTGTVKKEKEPEKVDVPDIVKELEKANKATVKRAVVDCLATFGIAKEHADFKELYNFIYRGSEFALRAQMQTRAVDTRSVDRFVRAHAEMYVRGTMPGVRAAGNRGSSSQSQPQTES